MVRISTFIDRVQGLTAPIGRNSIARSAIGSAQMGTFSLAKAVGTLASVDIGTILASYGSAGTQASRVIRAAYGSLSGTLTVPRAHVRFGSFYGTVTSPMIRGDRGSYSSRVTVGSLQVRARYMLGSVGSYSRLVPTGSLSAARSAGSITRGTFARGRILQLVGTHIAGSLLGDAALSRRYVVWPTPFANATYLTWASSHGGSSPSVGLAPAIIITFSEPKKAGSVGYIVTSAYPGGARRNGSINFYGLP